MKYVTVSNPVKGLWSEFDTLANRVFGGWDASLSGYWPKVDVQEKADAYILEADLPGYREDQVEVKVKDNLLSLSSLETEKDAKAEADESVFLIRERTRGAFSRAFKLPKDVDTDHIEATFKHGVLTLVLHRRPEVQPRTITIKGE